MDKLKVVKTTKACEMLGCSRATFVTKYEKLLKKYKDPNGHHTYFMLADVEKLAKRKQDLDNGVISDFEVVE